MPSELMWLSWSIVLGLVHVLVAAAMGTWQRGLKWNVGNRDGIRKPLTGMAARAERANRNFLETFAFFAAAALTVVLAHKSGASSVLGAQVYFWARVAYLPIYLVGIPCLRTLVWAASLWGILQLIEALL
jgi:uncharacterized MAPEG superfamily protein